MRSRIFTVIASAAAAAVVGSNPALAAKKAPPEKPPVVVTAADCNVERLGAAIDPADIGAVAAVALTAPGHEGAALELSGPEPLTPADQVALLAAALDRPLAYEPADDATARAEMEADTPKPFVDAFFRFFSEGEYDDARVVDTVERVLGRPPRRFAEWAADHADDFRA